MKKIFIGLAVLALFLAPFSRPVYALTTEQQIVLLKIQILQLQLQIAQILERMNTQIPVSVGAPTEPKIVVEKVEEKVVETPAFTSLVNLSNGRTTTYPATGKVTYAYDILVSFKNADFAQMTCDITQSTWQTRLQSGVITTIYETKGFQEKKQYTCVVELYKDSIGTGEKQSLVVVFP